jgi:hypothetical protein
VLGRMVERCERSGVSVTGVTCSQLCTARDCVCKGLPSIEKPNIQVNTTATMIFLAGLQVLPRFGLDVVEANEVLPGLRFCLLRGEELLEGGGC